MVFEWEELVKLFKRCLEKQDILFDCANAVVELIYKKRNSSEFENYSPINLLSQIYILLRQQN